MHIAIASAFGCGVGVWKRLADEGNDVLVWVGSDHGGPLVSHRHVGKGIVPRTDSWYALLAWAKEHRALVVFDSSGLGRFADMARAAGLHVVGGGSFMDRLEKDRRFGIAIAEKAGIAIPPYVEFSSLDETIAYAKSGELDREVYFKSDSYISGDATHKAESPEELVEYLTWLKTQARTGIRNILQDVIPGFALSTARWWNGRAWIGPYEYTFERKKFMAGEIGPSTGCSLNAVGFYDSESPAIAEALYWEAMGQDFLKHDAPPGLYDVNAVVNDGAAHFLEWTPRFGWDSEGTSLTQLYDDLGQALWHVATGQGMFSVKQSSIALSVRLSVPPYPSEEVQRDDKASCVGVPIRGATGDLWSEGFVAYNVMQDDEGLAVGAAEGIVGLAAAVGDSVDELSEEVLEFAKDALRVPGLQYRNDVAAALHEDAESADAQGFGDDLPSGLFE